MDSNINYEEVAEIHLNTVYSVILDCGSTHNVVVDKINNFFIIGRIAIERILYMYIEKEQLECEFGICESMAVLEELKEKNILEATKIFIALPRAVVIPLSHISLVEEGPFSHLESHDPLGADVIFDKDAIAKISLFKSYRAENGGFFSNPVIINQPSSTVIPFKTIRTGAIKK